MGVMDETQTMSVLSSVDSWSLLEVFEEFSEVIWATTSQIWLNFVGLVAIIMSSEASDGDWLIGCVKAVWCVWLIEVDEVNVVGLLLSAMCVEGALLWGCGWGAR